MTFSDQIFKKLQQNPNKIWIEATENINHAQVLNEIECLKEKLKKVVQEER